MRRSEKKHNQFIEIMGTLKRVFLKLWLRLPIRLRAALIIIAAFLLVSGIYNKMIHGRTWMSRTTINGVDVSGKTIDQSLDLLPDGKDYSLLIHGRGDRDLTILASDIGYHISMDRDKMEDFFKKQHALIRFPWSSRSYKVKGVADYDESMLTNYLDQCLFMKGSEDYPITEPVSADVVYSKKEKKPVVKKEVYGNSLNKDVFCKAVEEAIKDGVKEIDLDDKDSYPDMYKAPGLTSDSKEIKQGVEDYKAYVNRYICWDMWEGETYTITPDQILDLAYYKDGKMACRIYKLEKIIHKLCDKYRTAGKDRNFVTHKGKTVRITEGDYGWNMDYAKTLDQAETALAENLDADAADRYLADPSESNRAQVTVHLKPQYKTEAFRRDDKTYQEWDPDTYTEVSIAEQKIYVHRKGKIAFSCRTISGLPVEGRETGKGVYSVKGRSKDRVLKGDDYETPVKYWIRLTTSGTGFHAAPWQQWDKWSRTYYKKHGSHGCLNLSDADAKKMYEILEKGEAVFIY